MIRNTAKVEKGPLVHVSSLWNQGFELLHRAIDRRQFCGDGRAKVTVALEAVALLTAPYLATSRTRTNGDEAMGESTAMRVM